jgi:hypothetical protein
MELLDDSLLELAAVSTGIERSTVSRQINNDLPIFLLKYLIE